DEYLYALPMGKPPKESVIAARFQNREAFAGGVFAAANFVAAICREVEVITSLGSVNSFESLVRNSLRPNVKLNVVKREGAPTTLKQRFVDPSNMRKQYEVYYMDDEPLLPPMQADFDAAIAGDVARRLVNERIDCERIIVTHGKHGCVTCERDGTVHTIPAVAKKVVDTIGAGDAFFAVTAPLAAAGGALDKIGLIGNVVG